MRSLLLILFVACSVSVWAQDPTPSAAPNPQAPDSASSQPARSPNLAPPRSDRVNADALGGEPGESSSKETKVDLSPPADDDKAHPQSSDLLVDESRGAAGNADVSEFHPWNPHKAAKDVEVGDFYFKRKNYRAAADRYREALMYKDNDAVATIRLAVCLEKLGIVDDALAEYQSYLRILPHGPQASEAEKAINRLKAATGVKQAQ